MTRTNNPYVCPAELSGSLDNFLRRMIHNPSKILSPYIERGMSVLDLGCGPGYFTVELAKLAGEEGKVIAADLQPKMLAKMKKKISGTNLENRVVTHLCQGSRIGISEKVDFILAFWMVHEVPDHQALFEELGSILKPGGRILIAEPRIHVTKTGFEKMTRALYDAGLKVTGTPVIVLSRSVIVMRAEN